MPKNLVSAGRLGAVAVVFAVLTFQRSASGETNPSASTAHWHFSPFETEAGGVFGVLDSDLASEYQILFGSCDLRQIDFEIDFGHEALAELFRTDSYPIVRFFTDEKKTDLGIGQINFNEGPTGGPWNAKISYVDKELIQKVSSAKSFIIELVGRTDDNVEHVFTRLDHLPDRGRKATFSSIAKRCF
ncbi:hypothetical protein [Methylocystis bryophila]|uniref:Uncharacterized protein n=1 Tax=Methylocystis bryophila TaxID=655015 RepID=A0A1W6MST1_9HYPH|nr:hypothetical protein [Methylocystis bryophila]ARN80627.1 hypothetical protein B1812_05580 [Methylocystis bryophila]BDV40687.1 hypothetical protein DSM21852_39400 [Methylocystis bryophila]